MNRLLLYASLIIALGCTAPTTDPVYGTRPLIEGAFEISNPAVKIKFRPPAPQYPRDARMAGIMGDVTLNVTIDTNGIPIDAKPIAGPLALRPTARHYLLSVEFYPVMKDGSPTQMTFQFTMPFRLR